MANAYVQKPPLTLAEYAEKANQTDRFAEVQDGETKLAFGFFGEVGGLLAAVKKVSRDQLRESETEVAGEEIGDALWYLFALATAKKVDPVSVGRCCLGCVCKYFADDPRDRQGISNFRQIDGLIASYGTDLGARRRELLGDLARMAGEMVSHGGRQLVLEQSTVTDSLGQLLAMLALSCASFMLKLEDVARDNLVKVYGRWPGNEPKYVPLFDSKYPEHERLPRRLPMEFVERATARGTYVVQRLRGVYIGDRLTDNSNEPDDYRFHDVFHLAYAAHLGWSPVIRALLKHKRKSDQPVDENEDGARAMIIEEGIATWIFNHAKKRDFYEDVPAGKLDYGLLKQVQSMVSGYEVDACPLWQWERAILDGFRVFREMRKEEHRGGTVIVNMDDHTLSFEPPQEAQYDSELICERPSKNLA
ncbi:nucleoside triphosphate pyrophosphohydrolase family protein [Cupriavidus sp. KK10]|jgi:NTP pyrophosphatase (non-canonical NTP hydrolase)|uniref:nucleoside triphosphate pyrophosphohydrolase family protein n=1 Tax=Cupriavidus sp. KK10 TaxID=1478019 RepID=UPI001BA9C1F6|nr:nucleoside triphosphate pyrophosphohydrolase family protein [Cupriavidus sp. KK10]QUN27216.1 nucleoside triphosphate pyrophosphohydrolase family protein [Cupriavidus sp. KK10]